MSVRKHLFQYNNDTLREFAQSLYDYALKDKLSAEGLSMNNNSTGLILPKMTTTQREAIAAPIEGAAVYDTTLHIMYVWDGTAWKAAWA